MRATRSCVSTRQSFREPNFSRLWLCAKTIERSGLGKSLFYEMRYDDEGREIPSFVLNRPAYRKAQILVAGENFFPTSTVTARVTAWFTTQTE